MYDKQVQVETILASGFWVAGSALIVVAILVHMTGTGPAGVALILAGCMIDIHGLFDDLKRREARAFELGRRLAAISDRDRTG